MAQDDFPPFRTPALGRWIARAFVTVWAGLKASRPRGLGRLWARLVETAQRRYLVPVYLIALILSPFWALLVFEVLINLLDQLSLTPPAEPDARRAHFYAIGLTITGLGALLAAPFILIKAWVNERTARTAEQGHITDRITKAVEQLGAEKTVKVLEDGKTLERTEPNLEVRLGAIYALERIAQDSERDHIPIMETLCAYVRENSNARAVQEHDLPDWEPLPENTHEVFRAQRELEGKLRFGDPMLGSGKTRRWAAALPAPRADVQAALTVIGRRGGLRRAHEAARAYRLDLRAANLQGADLSGLTLSRARLVGARMEGANLIGVRMEGTDLRTARLEGADLCEAHLEGADLIEARMEDANLREAQLEGADLHEARLEGANLTKARMEGVSLRLARMSGAELYEVCLKDADISEALMEGANLRFASMERANLRFARMESVVFIKGRLKDANLSGAQLNESNLSEAQLDGASLSSARLAGADLTLAQMEGADLWGANLKSADLMRWNNTRTNARSADFTGAKNMTQDQVNSLFGDRATILPEGLRRTDLMDREPLEYEFSPDPDYQGNV